MTMQPSSQANIGNALLGSLIKLRQQKGGLKMEDVGAMFEKMASSLQAGSITDDFLKQEIEKLATFIDMAKQEVSGLSPVDGNASSAGDAFEQLDAVIKATEEASNTIMDAADKVQAAAAGVGGEKEQQIMDATMKIYEACNFQDLTGQRITKVIKVLSDIDQRITKIMGLFGAQAASARQEGGAQILDMKNIDEKSLMNGPQLKGPSQDDIDALFNNM